MTMRGTELRMSSYGLEDQNRFTGNVGDKDFYLTRNTCAEISRKSISWFNIFIMDRVNNERLLLLLFQNIGQ